MRKHIILLSTAILALASCKTKGCTDENAFNFNPEAEKNDETCNYAPSTYSFTDANGNNTVSYSGQTDRLNQLSVLSAYAKSANETIISEQVLIDMFRNTGGDGNGNFTFSSTKQLANKFFELDTAMMYSYFDSVAENSQYYARTASAGVSGTITSGSSTYIVNAGGIEYPQLIEKITMGAVFMYQSLNSYLDDSKMDVDNTSAVDPDNGKYYTTMEHHFDEAFGYLGIAEDAADFADNNVFWGKYANGGSGAYSSQSLLDAFSLGRYAITQNDMTVRDQQRAVIISAWAQLCAYKAVDYLDQAVTYFGSDQAKYLHTLSEAYAFIYSLKYVPTQYKQISLSEIEGYLTTLGDDFWNITDTQTTLNTIKDDISAKAGL